MDRVCLLIACYPTGKPGDVDAYATALAAVFGEYTEEVIMAATDPVRGIARECRFMPSVADVIAFCEDLCGRPPPNSIFAM